MRPPGYETLDRNGAGRPAEFTGRETMAQRRPVDVGRPRGAAARAGGRGPDAATLAMQTELAQADLECMRRRMRLLELQAR